jgi:UDP-GlcNAc:undecaprenyl-phosphate GlcNAc-1-phosphate transferase
MDYSQAINNLFSGDTIYWVNNIYVYIAVVVFFTFSISYILAPFFRKLANRLQIVDNPSNKRASNDNSAKRRIHTKISARSGGLGIFITLMATGMIIFYSTADVFLFSMIALSITIIFVSGIIDDRYEISGKAQLFSQFLACIPLLWAGLSISSLGSNEYLGFLSADWLSFNFYYHLYVLPRDLFTVLWLLVIINALNWTDGLDGLASSIIVVAAVTIGIINLKFGNYPVAIMCFILAGSTLGYLPFNFPPSKSTFLGSSGVLVAGLLLGILSILGASKAAGAILVLALPIVDMAWVLTGRILRHRVFNPLDLLKISDKTHLHHRLMDLGLTHRHVLLTEVLIVLGLALVPIFWVGSWKLAGLGVVILLALFIFLVIKIINKRHYDRIISRENNVAKRNTI